MKKKNKLTKSRDKIVSGVFGGIAEYFDWDKAIVRIVGTILIFFPGQLIVGIIIYFIAAAVMPEAPSDKDSSYTDKDDDIIEGEFKDK
ncbi:PspC domain-containing protein [Liquorilactobacillus oeni]|nr:PspC domain-containing protein [Liquorilactobacillus oeni]